MTAAVFFDFDGVLADSVDVKTKAFCAIYEPYGPDVVARVRAHHLEHGGVSRFEKFRLWQRDYVRRPYDEATIAALSERFSHDVKARVIASPEIPGANATLAALHEAGVPLFVVSGTPEEELQDIVMARGISRLFTAVRGAPQKKAAILHDLMAHNRLAAAECMMIGDAMTDYDAARDTGVPFIGIASSAQGPGFPPGTEVYPDLMGLANRLIGNAALRRAAST